MEKLGKQAKDKITGFEGIITGKALYLYGCTQYGLAAPMKDGKIANAEWFDEGRIEITGHGISAIEVQGEKPGGPNRDCPK